MCCAEHFFAATAATTLHNPAETYVLACRGIRFSCSCGFCSAGFQLFTGTGIPGSYCVRSAFCNKHCAFALHLFLSLSLYMSKHASIDTCFCFASPVLSTVLFNIQCLHSLLHTPRFVTRCQSVLCGTCMCPCSCMCQQPAFQVCTEQVS